MESQNPPKDLSHDRRASISPTEEKLGILKFAAQLAARYGTSFLWLDLMQELNLFGNHIHLFKSEFFYGLVDSYEQVLQPYNEVSENSLLARFIRHPPVDKLEETATATTAMIDFDAFVAGVDSFARMDYPLNMPRPKPLSLIMNQLTETPPVNQYGAQDIQPADPTLSGISLVELDIIKLTAQFVARYGPSFQRALMRTMAMKPQFEFLYYRPDSVHTEAFMEQTKSRFIVFKRLASKYCQVLKNSGKLKKWDACTGPLLEDFLRLLELEKLEERVETAMIGLHAFVCGVDYFAFLEDVNNSLPPPERLSMMMNSPLVGSQLTKYLPPKQDKCTHDYFTGLDPMRRFFRFPAEGITVKELGILKLTALFAARYGTPFRHGLMKILGSSPLFEFMSFSDSRDSHFFSDVWDTYIRVLKLSKKPKKSTACADVVLKWFFNLFQLEKGWGTATGMLDLHAFLGGVDCFAYMDDVDFLDNMPPSETVSKMVNRLTEIQPDMLVQLPAGSVGDAQFDVEPSPLMFGHLCHLRWNDLKELGIMKLTALFVARYGAYFCWELTKKVVMKPQFNFMNPTDNKFRFYNQIVDAYERVLKPCDDKACYASIVDAFFSRLQLKKLEEGAWTAMIDLHASLCGVDYFVRVEDEDAQHSIFMPDPLLLTLMLKELVIPWIPRERLPLIPRLFFNCYGYDGPSCDQPGDKPGMSSHPPLPLPKEREPKRKKVGRVSSSYIRPVYFSTSWSRISD